MFKVITTYRGKRTAGAEFGEISRAQAEAQKASEHLGQSAVVYVDGENLVRCLYEEGKLVLCRCIDE